jgi:Lar family restriction alleviation protein
MTKLKPCPFCGGEAHISADRYKHHFWIECRECGASQLTYRTEEEVISAWNQRTEHVNDVNKMIKIRREECLVDQALKTLKLDFTGEEGLITPHQHKLFDDVYLAHETEYAELEHKLYNEQDKHKWIYCLDELPQPDKLVTVAYKTGCDDKEWRAFTTYLNGAFFAYTGEWESIKSKVYWCYLPEFPKENEQ